MNDIIWLTNIDTAEPVGVSAGKIVLIEQKRAQDGGAVAIYLEHGKEIYVSESLARIAELTDAEGPAMRPPVTHLHTAG